MCMHQTTEQQKLVELRRKIDKSTILVGDFNASFSAIERTTRWNISNDIKELNTINQEDLIDIYKTLHATTVEFTLFSSACETCTMICHILAHKTNLNKFKRYDILHSIFLDDNGIKLESNSRNLTGKSLNT